MMSEPHVASARRRRTGRGEVSMVPEMTPQSYYGRPILKAPVWQPEIGVYFFVGGIAGASTLLAAAARQRGNRVLADRALFTALAGVTVSPLLLIADLGVPRRFLNMLRVFKVTSPMSLGTWLLNGAGISTGVAAGCRILGILPRVQRLAELSAGLLGPGVSTYTAVLIADTAVPVWHEARLELPFVFAGSSLASAGALLTLVTPEEHARPARTLAVAGVAGGMVALQVMEQRLGEAGEPYRSGEPRRFATLAKALSVGGAAVMALGGNRRRRLTSLGAGAVLAGAMCERWSIFTAGPASAADPRYTVTPQRERLRQQRREQHGLD
jgi:formate-dependent nitrite reductase membrane component NrfD